MFQEIGEHAVMRDTFRAVVPCTVARLALDKGCVVNIRARLELRGDGFVDVYRNRWSRAFHQTVKVCSESHSPATKYLHLPLLYSCERVANSHLARFDIG